MLEMGMFNEEQQLIGGIAVSPREVLLDALDRTLPRGASDVVLIRVWRDQHGARTTLQVADTGHGGFSALARTTAFPATALADLMARGVVDQPGVFTMNEAVGGQHLLPELAEVGIEVESV
jgi:saccharopine dehydrogenase-like NADP-dependent oxidoreductase